MTQYAIEVKNLTKYYVNLLALNGISFNIEQGESVGLIGSNGAGKSTLINILMGFLNYNEGTARILGYSSRKVDEELKQRIGFIPEETTLLPWATVDSLAQLYNNLYPNWDWEKFENFCDNWGLNTIKQVRHLSKGQRRLAELALCFSTNPDILLMDEPFNGLDAMMRIKVREELKNINADKSTTLFYSSHILTDVEKISHRIIILKVGDICLNTAVDELKRPIEEVFSRHYGLRQPDEMGEY